MLLFKFFIFSIKNEVLIFLYERLIYLLKRSRFSVMLSHRLKLLQKTQVKVFGIAADIRDD